MPTLNAHRLRPDRHADFLAQGKADPFSRVRFQPGAVVVRCPVCGTAFLRESWDALGGRHCDQAETMAQLTGPVAFRAPTPGPGPVAAAPLATPAAAAPPPPEDRRRSPWPWILVGAVALVAIIAVALLLKRDRTPEPVVTTEPGEVTAPTLTPVQLGSVDGRLEAGDDTTNDGRLFDAYTFRTSGRGPFSFAVEGRFEPLLVVTSPDGGRWEAPQGEDRSRAYIVVPTGRGSYTVRVSARASGVEGEYALAIQPQRREAVLRPATAVTDSLGGPDSYQNDGRAETAFTIDLAQNARITVSLAASGFTPRLQITGPGGVVRTTDGTAADSRTYAFTAPGTGRYTIILATSGANERGAFRIRADVVAPPAAPVVPTLNIGEPSRGTLAAGATDVFRFDALDGQRLVLAVAAERFTPRLRLLSSDGAVVATGGDALAATLSADGTYRIELSSTADSTGGPYALTARVLAPEAGEDDEPIESEIRREPPGRELPTESERPVGSATYNVTGTDRRTEAVFLPPNPGVEATGVYRVVVAPDGSVTQAEISRRSGNAVLDADALRALRRWRFEAAAGTEPTAVTVTIRFTTR